MTIMHAARLAKSAAFLAATLFLAPLPATAQTVAQAAARAGAAVTATAPWARAAVGRTGAAYVTLATAGATGDGLVGAATPIAETAELHTHVHDNGVMKMRPAGAIEIRPGAPVVFAPGGLHIMLIGLKGPLRQGDHFPLTLTFAGAGPVTIDVPVLGAGASGP